jgi:hypothetical protein
MGLDMYAYTAPADRLGDKQVDLNDQIFENGSAREGVDTDFAYWRKFNNLHGWMAELYYSKGGSKDVFNCTTVRLMPHDLDRLWNEAQNLKPKNGFFWGDQEDMTDDRVEDVKAFVTNARAAIAEGKAVIYDSWW